MNHEYTMQDAFSGQHSWYWRWLRRGDKWGGIQIHRVATFAGRGGIVRVAGYGTRWQDGKAPFVDVYVSDAGQSVRVFLNGHTELTPTGKDET